MPLYERARLALKLKPIIEEKAKEQQRTQTQQGYQKSDKAVHTTVELAKTAGVSHDTIHKVEKIEEKALEEVKRQVYICSAYNSCTFFIDSVLYN